MGLLGRLKNKYRSLKDLPHWIRLRALDRSEESEYGGYLRVQLRRSLSNRSFTSGAGAHLLIDRLVDYWPSERPGKVLCIGCRNTSELDYFEGKGDFEVIGIDLFSTSSRVHVMDMHHMTFPDRSFDIVFASHSLEHSMDANKVAREITRVARPGALLGMEVPVGYKTGGADLVDFKNVEGLLEPFELEVEEVLWSDEQPPKSPTNRHNNRVVRAVVSLKGAG